jgi:anti-anti-sigma factor
MQGVELSTSACDGHVGVSLHGELDVTSAAEAEAAITALVARDQYLVIDMSTLDFIDCNSLGARLRARELARYGGVASIARRQRRYPWRRLAVRTARLGRATPSRTGTG